MSLKSFDLMQPDFTESLERSVSMWLNNNFFQDGGYINTSGNLESIKHPQYTDGHVFASKRKNWIWESGNISVEVGGSSITPSGVNYRDGLIILNEKPSGGDSVFAEYAYRYVDIYNTKDTKRGASLFFEPYDKVYRENTFHLPAIGIEVGGSNSNGTEIGSYSRNDNTTILLNIFHNSHYLISRISNILYNQVDSHIGLFDFFQTYKSGVYPIDFDGFLLNSSGTYNILTQDFPLSIARNSASYIVDTEKEEPQYLDNSLWHSTVRLEIETQLSMGIS